MFILFGSEFGYGNGPGFWVHEMGHEMAFVFSTDGGVWLTPFRTYTERSAADTDLAKVKDIAKTMQEAADILGVPFRKSGPG